MKRILSILLTLCCTTLVHAQLDSTLFKRNVVSDSTTIQLNMDAVYNRPFLQMNKFPVSLGGYVEANTNYAVRDGVTEGFSFQMRRFTLFMSSSIGKRIRFLSELEFEDGTKEINIEFAAVDVEFHPLFNLRSGVIMNPIGAFNQNHDGPKWEFIDRPLSATTIIPSTWSNVGVGLYGKYYKGKWAYAYEAYLTNGFDGTIISNGENRTWFPASKMNRERFEESFNGQPLTTAKIAVRNRKIAELGLSWMGGIYNKFEEDGIQLDKKRRLDFLAIDFNTTLFNKTFINGEWVWAMVDVPATYSQQYGERQRGGFVDVVHPFLKRKMIGFEKAVLNIVARVERVDYNVGLFNETGDKIYDELWSIMPGVSFRPYPQTVFRFNYRYQWDRDILGNPPSKMATFQFGFSSYF